MLGSSEWRMPLNVLILEFFSLYFHFSSFLRGKIDTNKRLCLVFRNVLTFRIEIDESKKTFCDIKMPVVCCARAGCWRQVLHIFRFGEYKLLYESLLILSQTRTTYEAQVFLVYLKIILALSFRISCIYLRLFHVILCYM